MVYQLKDANEFLVVPYYNTTNPEIGVYNLKVGLDTYPLNEKNWAFREKINPKNNGTLEVYGHTLSDQELGDLINKLRMEHLIVNCDGACYVKNFEFEEEKVKIEKNAIPPTPTTYLRLADAFPWSDFGVTNFKFSGFSPPKFLTKGGTIDPNNLVPSPDRDALNKAQTTITGLNNTISNLQTTTSGLRNDLTNAQTTITGLRIDLRAATNGVKTSAIAAWSRAAGIKARPLSPYLFNVVNADPDYYKKRGGQFSDIPALRNIQVTLLDPDSNPANMSPSITVYTTSELDTTFWWIAKIYLPSFRHIHIAYYDGSCGKEGDTQVPWPTDNASTSKWPGFPDGTSGILWFGDNVGSKFCLAIGA